MSESTLSEFVEHEDFSRFVRVSIFPDLIEIQKRSYEEFLQMEVEPDRRKDQGLQAALASVFPITDYNNAAALEFSNYCALGDAEIRRAGSVLSRHDVCRSLEVACAAHLCSTRKTRGPKKKVLDVREQEVYVGELPLMTERGTFPINGTERVVVSQLHRSPARPSRTTRGVRMPVARSLYSARIIPYRGSWLDFEFDARISCMCVSIVGVKCRRPFS